MDTFKIDDMKGGWFIGDFEPSMHKTQSCEVAYKEYNAGFVDKKHHHKIATEFTLIIKGHVKMNDLELTSGEGVMISPGESVEFTALEDTSTMVVKIPGASDDKYID